MPYYGYSPTTRTEAAMHDPILSYVDVVPFSSRNGAIILVGTRGMWCSWCGEPIYTTTAAPDAHLTVTGRNGLNQIGCGTPYMGIAIVDLDPGGARTLAATEMGQLLPILTLSELQIEHVVTSLWTSPPTNP